MPNLYVSVRGFRREWSNKLCTPGRYVILKRMIEFVIVCFVNIGGTHVLSISTRNSLGLWYGGTPHNSDTGVVGCSKLTG